MKLPYTKDISHSCWLAGAMPLDRLLRPSLEAQDLYVLKNILIYLKYLPPQI
ncbi:hypothetical protein [Acaryochloris sp. IP29b_bin.148]|uniref:hypothetical protein n=1 Tax=Acaryochloris sp. IP29b_bin.148 TaxID=2969218 RepID=UPI00262D13B2|nr:hypothetical protein [Acaryochloris sp. IP29b_bin.148]